MMPAALVLLGALGAAPCARIAVAPFEPISTSAAEARRVESLVRDVLARRPGACVEPRAETIEHLRGFPAQRPPPCEDAACALEQLERLKIDELVTGLVVGAGGRLHLELRRATREGMARATGAVATQTDAEGLVATLSTAEPAPSAARSRVPALLTTVAALAAAGLGAGLGLEARRVESQLSSGATGCPAGAPAFAACVDGQLRDGRNGATASTALFIAGGVLAGGAVFLWVVDFP